LFVAVCTIPETIEKRNKDSWFFYIWFYLYDDRTGWYAYGFIYLSNFMH